MGAPHLEMGPRLWPLLLPCLALLLACLPAPLSSGAEEPVPTRDTRSDTWAATDALGRSLPGHVECGPPRPDKFVGLFYFLWLGSHGRGLYDNSRLLAANPQNPQYGPVGAFHFWSEPHLGYYLSDDEFVIRKHAQMLADAGVDMIAFDVTNAFTYDDVYLKLCRVFQEVRKAGGRTPQIAFLLNSSSPQVAQRLYDRLYAPGLYKDLWFRWRGKPLLMASPEGLSPELKRFFTLRHSWAWSDPRGWFGDGKDKWPWLDNHPQKPGWHESPDKPEQISVCAAQHPTTNIGRSFHNGKQPPPDERAPEKGLCFAEQWERALEVDPEMIFITGWNEWVAQRFLSDGGGHFLGKPLAKGDTFFVDQYNQEYSRDIEPMRGGHGDNYYYQMVAGIRRFKGVRPPERAGREHAIRLGRGFDQWRRVTPEYLDDLEDTAHRNHPGWEGMEPHVNKSGRNDFDLLKVARDGRHIHFYARTCDPITPPEGRSWMLLLLDTDDNPRTGWEGYDFIINRTLKGSSASLVERNVGGRWEWEPVTEVRFEARGREMHLSIPRDALGLEPDRGPLRLRFKWADNVPESPSILDFIDQGDAAPNGRFSYVYAE